MTQKTALIVGATGAIGRVLTERLISSPTYRTIIVLHHRATDFAGREKITEHIIDFDRIETLDVDQPVDHVFCCIGTTRKKAGSLTAFQIVDRDYPIALARWAEKKGVQSFSVISSLGASKSASSAYLRTKGEMEAGVRNATIPVINILRPSLLHGARGEFRLLEKVGFFALAILSPLFIGPFKKYRPVALERVAAVMINLAQSSERGVHIIESDRIQALGQE